MNDKELYHWLRQILIVLVGCIGVFIPWIIFTQHIEGMAPLEYNNYVNMLRFWIVVVILTTVTSLLYMWYIDTINRD